MIDPGRREAERKRAVAEFGEARGAYRVRFARSQEDLERVQRLRFEVFARELGARVDGAERGLDLDPLDGLVDHLLVVDVRTDECVGTYRLATREQVGWEPDFYTRRQFDLGRLDPAIEEEGVELGRACVALGHRSRGVFQLLLRGIGAYLVLTRKRYLFGCGSIHLKDPSEAAFVQREVERAGFVDPALEVDPMEGYRVPQSSLTRSIGPEVPPLLQAYCAMGARLARRPAFDRAFSTLDYFVLLDRERMAPRAFARYCGGGH